jgi:hypothetical protein
MEPDEIRAEIERRKKRAVDLKIRETLWSLYKTLKAPDTATAQLIIGPTIYDLIYKEAPQSSTRYSGQDRGDFEEEEIIIPATLALLVDNQKVFKFQIRNSTRLTREGPTWNNYLGDVTRFIEGKWVSELTEFLARRNAEQKALREQKEQPQLDSLRKRFGL